MRFLNSSEVGWREIFRSTQELWVIEKDGCCGHLVLAGRRKITLPAQGFLRSPMSKIKFHHTHTHRHTSLHHTTRHFRDPEVSAHHLIRERFRHYRQSTLGCFFDTLSSQTHPQEASAGSVVEKAPPVENLSATPRSLTWTYGQFPMTSPTDRPPPHSPQCYDRRPTLQKLKSWQTAIH